MYFRRVKENKLMDLRKECNYAQLIYSILFNFAVNWY